MRRAGWFSFLTVALLVGGIIAPARAGAPTCFGKRASIVGTSKDDRLRGTNKRDVILARGGNDIIRGRGGRDLLCGGAADDFISGGNGDDKVTGGAGFDDDMSGDGGDDVIGGGPGPDDDARYFTSPRGVTGSLVTNTVRGQGHDTLLPGVDELLGSRFGDVLSGDDKGQLLAGFAGDDTLSGGGGDDELGGGRGDDRVDGGAGLDLFNPLFEFRPPDGVDVNLATGVATGRRNGRDALTSIEASFGSPGDDVLVGDDNQNALVVTIDGHDVIRGAGGDDVVDGGDGNDELEGGPGRDYVGAIDHSAGVRVNLRSGTSTGKGQARDNDTLSGFEDVLGSLFNDTITGDDSPNALRGDVGEDTIHGLAGDDILIGDCSLVPGHFFFEGPCPDAPAGADSLGGGSGTDTCLDGETTTSCESTTPSLLRAAGSTYVYRSHLRLQSSRLVTGRLLWLRL